MGVSRGRVGVGVRCMGGNPLYYPDTLVNLDTVKPFSFECSKMSNCIAFDYGIDSNRKVSKWSRKMGALRDAPMNFSLTKKGLPWNFLFFCRLPFLIKPPFLPAL